MEGKVDQMLSLLSAQATVLEAQGQQLTAQQEVLGAMRVDGTALTARVATLEAKKGATPFAPSLSAPDGWTHAASYPTMVADLHGVRALWDNVEKWLTAQGCDPRGIEEARRAYDVVRHLLEDFTPVRYASSSILAYTAFRNSVTYIGLVKERGQTEAAKVYRSLNGTGGQADWITAMADSDKRTNRSSKKGE